MKRIAMINPYFGTFPNYFNLWLLSAKSNPSVDFFIFTDNSNILSENNIHIINITFEELKSRVQKLFSFEICLKEPYKLTDYKPAYGMIFKEYIKEYDYWGYYDIDVILGDIRTFISDDVLDGYDKLYKRGHFTLFKNNDRNNSAFLEQHQLDTYRYDEVYKTNYACHFDEIGICDIFDAMGLKTYYSVDYADVLADYNCFILYPENKYIPQVYKWENGKLYRIFVNNGEIASEESMYIHLQKRQMTIEFDPSFPVTSFYIIPNRFIIDHKEISTDEILLFSKKRFYPHKYEVLIRAFFQKFKNGAIKQRLFRFRKHLRFLWRKKNEKNIGDCTCL